MNLFPHRRRKMKHAKEQAQRSDQQRDRLEAQWPEVLGLASWAKNTREQNHLTELFLASRGKG